MVECLVNEVTKLVAWTLASFCVQVEVDSRIEWEISTQYQGQDPVIEFQETESNVLERLSRLGEVFTLRARSLSARGPSPWSEPNTFKVLPDGDLDRDGLVGSYDFLHFKSVFGLVKTEGGTGYK